MSKIFPLMRFQFEIIFSLAKLIFKENENIKHQILLYHNICNSNVPPRPSARSLYCNKVFSLLARSVEQMLTMPR